MANLLPGSNDGYIYAINPDGKLKWKFNAGTAVEAPPLVLGGTIYAGSMEGILFALDAKPANGMESTATDGQISGSQTLQSARIKNAHSSWLEAMISIFIAWMPRTGKFYGNMNRGILSMVLLLSRENLPSSEDVTDFCTLSAPVTGRMRNKIDIGTYVPASAAILGDKAFSRNYDGVFLLF